MNSNYYGKQKHNYMFYSQSNLGEYIASRAFELLGEPAHIALEVGAGMGRFSRPLVEKYSGTVLVEPVAAYAKHLYSQFNRQHVQIFNGTFQEYLDSNPISQSTDLFCFHVLHHLQPQQRSALYGAIRSNRMRAIFVEPNPFNPLIPVQILLVRDMSFQEEWQSFVMTKSRYKDELTVAGLELRAHKYLIPFLPPQLFNLVLPYSKRFSKLVDFCERIAGKLVLPTAYQLLFVQ